MELKEGYKLTEVGVIPEDWEVNTLGEMAQILRGGSPRPIEAYLTKNKDGYNWIKIGDVAPDAKYICATEEKIIKEGRDRSRFVYKGDFLLSNSMSFGRPYILQIDGCIHDGWLVIQNYKKNFDTDFLYYLLSSEVTFKQYRAKAAGSGVLNLNKELVASVLLYYPSKCTQKAIAAALSDVDALLSSLDALIAKKRDMKMAVMQELLTGKTRLPGFSGEWVKSEFGDIFDFLPTNAYTRSQFSSNGTIKNVHYGDILTKFDNHIDVGKIDLPYLNSKLSERLYPESSFLQEGDLIIANTAEDDTVGKAVEVINVKEKVLSGQHTFLARPKVKFGRKFIGYLINSYDFHSQLAPYVTGIKVSSISKNSLARLILKMPSDRVEQSAIAAVLSDMDAEIAALEARRAKVRALKQGMMQELLTGKTRLVPTGEQHG